MKTVEEITKVLVDTNRTMDEVNEFINDLTEEEAKNVLRASASIWVRESHNEVN